VHISPDGRRVLLDGDGLIWDVETGRTVKVGAVGSHVAFSPEGDWVATSTGDGAVVRDVLTGRSVTAMTVGTTEPAAIAFAGANRLFTVHVDGTTHEWGVGARRLVGDRGMALAAAASRDGKLVAGLSGTADPVVWDAASGRLRLGRPRHGSVDAQPSYVISFTPAGQLAHVVLDEGNLEVGYRVVDVPTGLSVRSFGQDVHAIDARAVQTLAVVGDTDSYRLRFTDARGRETVADAPPNTLEVFLSPDGRLAAISDGENAEIWETPRLRRRARLDADDSGPEMLRFSQDGARLLAVDLDGRVYVWNLATGQRVVITAHRGFINSAEFSDDGRYVVSAGEDGAARVWSANSGRLLVELPSSGAAALLPGNRALVTLGSGPPLIRECDGCGTWDELVRRIDARARRGLTPAERATYLR
jgi:WD40 repeat protein